MNSIFFVRFFFSFSSCEKFKVNPCSAKPTALHKQGDEVLGSFTLFLRPLVVYNQENEDTTIHL